MTHTWQFGCVWGWVAFPHSSIPVHPYRQRAGLCRFGWCAPLSIAEIPAGAVKAPPRDPEPQGLQDPLPRFLHVPRIIQGCEAAWFSSVHDARQRLEADEQVDDK